MKKKLFCFIICASSLCACNSENDYEVFGSSSTNETISANSMEYINQEYIPALDEEVVISVDTILYNGISTKENETLTRAIDPVYDGVAQGTPIKTESLKKVYINGVSGVVNGIYFADVYTTSGTITLPVGAKDVTFTVPSNCGYSDWQSREVGVIVSKVQTPSGTSKKIKWSFYTLVLRRNSAAQSLYVVLPDDGANVRLPYNFVY